MERMVIEKKRIMIFKGLTVVLLVSSLKTSLIGAKENAKRMTAPVRAIIQYVPNLTFPIFKTGKNKIERVISVNVMSEIIMVGIIVTRTLLCSLLCKSVSNLSTFQRRPLSSISKG